jgi:hypothetical protein
MLLIRPADPVSAVDTANNIQYITNAIYDAASLPTSFVSGASATFAGITNSFGYNARLQPLQSPLGDLLGQPRR